MNTSIDQSDLFADNDIRFDMPDADIRYVERFLDAPGSHYESLLTELDWRQDRISMYGRSVLIPRLNVWYGDPATDYSYSGLHMTSLPWTETLLAIRELVQQMTGEPFNSVLANLYRDGEDSVSWHSDDEAELGRNPVIASVSLGATRRFSLRHRFDRTIATRHLSLVSGSLLVMRGATQHYWQHQVPKQKPVTNGRINLTFRQIRHAR